MLSEKEEEILRDAMNKWGKAWAGDDTTGDQAQVLRLAVHAIVDAIAEERARPAREMLREHSHDSHLEKCIECDDYEHTPDCKLAAEIAKPLKVTT